MAANDLPSSNLHDALIHDDEEHNTEIDDVIPLPDNHSVDHFYQSANVPADMNTRKRLQRKIMKNVWLISVAFVLTFTSYNGLGQLQSSLFIQQGMGTVTQSVVYASMVCSCIFVPKLMINCIGPKWTIPLCIAGYVLWMAANGYAVWGTMVPTSILVGLCAAPLWTAQAVYFTKIAAKYAELSGDTKETVVAKMFGIFFGAIQLSNVVGSVIASTILLPRGQRNTTLTPAEVELYCGVNDCPSNNITNSNLDKPAASVLWTLVGLYMGLTCLGIILICACVDDIPVYLKDNTSGTRKELSQSLLNTVMHLKNKSQVLLVPLTVYLGLDQGFFAAEWNKSYVSCCIGIWMVGFVAIPAGVFNGLVAFAGGHLVKYTGRLSLFTTGMLIQSALLGTLRFWPLNQNKQFAFYLLAIIRSLAHGIWQTQINALYGAIFAGKAEAAFSNFKLWESSGFIIAFAYSSFLCTKTKLYVLFGMLLVGMTGYYITEKVESSKTNKYTGVSINDEM